MNARELEVTVREVRWSLTALLLAFLFCKLAEVTAIASWSWLWVLAPLWVPVVLAAGAVSTDRALARWDGWVLERKAAKRAEQARQDHTADPVAQQVETSRFVRPESAWGIVVRWSEAAGVDVIWTPERERYTVVDRTSSIRFDVTDDEVRHQPTPAPVSYGELFIMVAGAKLAELRR